MSAIKYFIVDYTDDPDNPIWKDAHQTPETVRRSRNGKKMILKYKERYAPEGGYTHAEILDIMRGEDWQEDDIGGD